jgi:ATP-binding cassette, subfamily B, bacterial
VRILWTYLRPYRWLVAAALLLAALAQVLTLVDPIIFGKILDDYALNQQGRTQRELVSGALWWLGLAALVALLARLARCRTICCSS